MSRCKKEEQLTRVFKALGNVDRRKILDLLKENERTTGEICTKFKSLDRCTVMQHLSVLEKAELIIVRREGKFRFNSLNTNPFQEIYDRYINKYASPAAEFLFELKGDLES